MKSTTVSWNPIYIKWKFNLSHPPWWGGQIKRLIDFVKATMYNVIGRATFSWDELSEVLLDAALSATLKRT